MGEYFKKTIIGGVLFLIPLSVIAYILFRIFKVFRGIAEFIDQFIPIKTIAGAVAVDVLAILLIVLVCFFFGLLAKASAIQFFREVIEDKILIHIPGYVFFKVYTKGMEDASTNTNELDPVLVDFDDNTQLGFLIHEAKEGLSTIYLPGSPNPWSGSVVYVKNSRIRQVDISSRKAFQHLQQTGRNSDFINK